MYSFFSLATLGLLATHPVPAGDWGEVRASRKISDTAGGFTGGLAGGDWFGAAIAPIGDLDGDGTTELAIGAPFDDRGARYGGILWIAFLNPDETVRDQQPHGPGLDGWRPLGAESLFGHSVAPLGDLDGDGVPDVAVGAPTELSFDSGLVGLGLGEVWVLLLRSDGTAKSRHRIRLARTSPGHATPHPPGIDYAFFFGTSLANLGDLDHDGFPELAVGEPGSQDGACTGHWECGEVGAVWIVFLGPDGTAKRTQKISATEGGFTGSLHDFDRFGSAVAAIGDLDGDGVNDLAVGTPGDDFRNDSFNDSGAVYVLFLNADGTAKAHQKIDEVRGGFTGPIGDGDGFGTSVASLPPLDGDGVRELVVGATGDDDGGAGRGAAWILSLREDGTVRNHRKISAVSGVFPGPLDNFDNFGSAAAWLGDLDGDGRQELAVGATGDDDGGSGRGAAWILTLDDVPPWLRGHGRP